MALACAVDPEACNVPDAHAMPPVDPADPAAGVVPEDDVLLSEPHAVNVSVPATITAAAPIRRVRLTTFTVSFISRGYPHPRIAAGGLITPNPRRQR